MKLLIWPLLTTIILLTEPTVQVYKGGRWGYSGITLILNPDSTFAYSSWYHHSKGVSKDKGTWQRRGNYLVLNSRRKKKGFFHKEFFRMTGDTLKLYSKEDSIKDYDFYRRYYTLRLQRPSK
ncbi:copper resistance protein NlpE N-terminal domain-containing protein [Hymenobacter sp. B81]|uniref:copper resistance protein NlpE N-terminal domain-containing protein n=1 Tax=Hymenobacter sp. B81 TaxID=3344878 RepID=UPI0037DD0958